MWNKISRILFSRMDFDHENFMTAKISSPTVYHAHITNVNMCITIIYYVVHSLPGMLQWMVSRQVTFHGTILSFSPLVDWTLQLPLQAASRGWLVQRTASISGLQERNCYPTINYTSIIHKLRYNNDYTIATLNGNQRFCGLHLRVEPV